MRKISKKDIVKTSDKPNYSGCTDSKGDIDKEKKSEIYDSWKFNYGLELEEWKAYKKASAMVIDEFEYQLEDAVLTEVKKDADYIKAHKESDAILLLEVVKM